MNLLVETIGAVKENGKEWEDVAWVGTTEVEIPKDAFEILANKEYDSGYGSQKVATDLIVVGDNWYLERHEYDGSEWWECKAIPIRPRRTVVPKTVVDNGFMWCTLREMNNPGGKYDGDPFWNWDGMELAGDPNV